MIHFKNNIRQLVLQEIVTATDANLNDSNFALKIEQKYKPKSIHLSKQNILSDIKTISMEEYSFATGIGMAFSQSAKAEHVQIQRLAEGPAEIFDLLKNLQRLPNSKICQTGEAGNKRGIIYNGYSKQLTNNESEIARIRSESEEIFSRVEKTFEEFNSELHTFWENEIKPHILPTITKEIEKRNAKKNTISKLSN